MIRSANSTGGRSAKNRNIEGLTPSVCINDCDTRTLLEIVAKTFDIPKEDLCSRGKSSGLVDAKEVLILSGRRLGASLAEMSDLIGINASTASRRYDTAKRRVADDHHMSEAVANVIRQYEVHKT